MDFLHELKWRNILHDMTPGIEEALEKGKVIGYIGFDPTAPSLTIGNYVPIMLLKLFQESGHQPIVLMGGATGRIGDPSGKDQERQLKSYEELDNNLQHQVNQVKQMLNFETGDNKAILVNNLDFYKDMGALEFLRDVGKNLTVNYMMTKDSVKNRLDTGLSFTEFSYQLLQAYDFVRLYKDYDCLLQMGGSDQWGNITSGTELVRRMLGGKAYAATAKLLTKADGKKFGKSEQGNIWLDPKMTSPYKFYQFWINADDRDIATYIGYFTLKSEEEAKALIAQVDDNPRMVKQTLAEELTRRIHGDEAYEAVVNVSELLFNRKANRETLLKLSSDALTTVAGEIPRFRLSEALVKAGLSVTDLLAEHTSILSSNSEVRRMIKSKCVYINKLQVQNHEDTVAADQLLHERFLMVEVGKKNKYIVEIDDEQ